MKLFCKFCSVLIFLTFIEWTVGRSEEDVLKFLRDKLGYDSSITRTLIPPEIRTENGSNEAVNVSVNIFMRNFESIDEMNMEMKTQVTVRMSWLDPRLSHSDILRDRNIEDADMIRLTDTSKIWIPDVFFSNEKQAHAHNLIKPNSFIIIHPNGTVLFSRRISLTLSCPMDLKYFPHDKQVCSIRLATYHSSSKYVLLRWKSENPIQVVKYLHMPKFTLLDWTYHERVVNTSISDYSYVEVDFLLRREFFNYYFKKFYAPVVTMVLISWIPFWLKRVLTLRIYIAMSTVLFLGWYYTVQDAGLLISYNTALNIWNFVNFTFVFLAALESLGIVFMIKTNSNALKKINPDDKDEFKIFPYGPEKRRVIEIVDEKTNAEAEIMKIKTNYEICFINVHKEVKIIDAVAKLFFPLAYLLFIFFYWITYVPN